VKCNVCRGKKRFTQGSRGDEEADDQIIKIKFLHIHHSLWIQLTTELKTIELNFPYISYEKRIEKNKKSILEGDRLSPEEREKGTYYIDHFSSWL
jgi:hypothetical protein